MSGEQSLDTDPLVVVETFDEDDVRADEVELPTVYTEDPFSSVEASTVTSGNTIPDLVKKYIVHFHTKVLEKSLYELQGIYENAFNKLSDAFYAKSTWPDAESIAPLVGDDPVFLILYKELYYRHIYSRLNPTLQDRVDSYTNYCDLFNYILNSSDEPCDLELPNQWLWDIIDEFIYQFQAFSSYRSNLKKLSSSEVELLRERPDVWNVHNVLNVLYSLIQKSQINQQLLAVKTGGDVQAAAGDFGSKPLYRMLGYFSLVGLLRVHTLLGDYTLALETISNIQTHHFHNRKGLFARVTACHVTTYYYLGFANMMLRRYTEAIRAFINVLNFINRTRNYYTKSYSFEMINKKSDQMLALLAICLALAPQRVDEQINVLLKEKFGEQYFKMQKGEDALPVFEELFSFACPKFIAPAPDYDDISNSAYESTRHQLKIFLSEVKTQLMVPAARSYLKLYTVLEVEKLASFLDMSPEEVRRLLLVYKHKSRQLVSSNEAALNGNGKPVANGWDLQFYLKEDVIYIAENKPQRKVSDWFIRNINKFDDLVNQMQNKSVKA